MRERRSFKEFKICGSCNAELPKDNDNFYRSSNSKDGLYGNCKKCDDYKRLERYKTKASHNVNRICKQCNKFFYAELCRVRKGISNFCSNACRGKYARTAAYNDEYLSLIDNKGSKNPNARLKEKDVIAIKRALQNNEDVKSISKRFKISQSHISNIKAGRIWKSIVIDGVNYEK